MGIVNIRYSLWDESSCRADACLQEQSPVFQAWLNEKFSPELLENKSELVECVMEQITHMVWIYVYNGQTVLVIFK